MKPVLKSLFFAGAFALVVLATPAVPASTDAAPSAPDCERVYGIGDLHGGHDALVSILRTTELIDSDNNWAGGRNCLVQTGDLVDRGERSREVLELLMKLERQAEGRLRVLLGNHEVMNLTDDLRYVEPGEFGAYAGDETAAEREAGYVLFLQLPEVAELTEEQRRYAFERAHPPGWFAHRRAFKPGGRYHDWLAGKPIAARVGDTLFTHGGLSVADAEAGIAALNDRAAADLKDYRQLRQALERGGLIHPLASYGDAVRGVHAWIQANQPVEGEEDADPAVTERRMLAQRFMALRGSPIFRTDGPLWNRDFAEGGDEYAPSVTEILETVGAKRVLVGHTTMENHRVNARFDERVFLMDTGAGPAYGGRVSTLEVFRNGRVRAVYLDDAWTIARPDFDWLEQALAEGEILENEPLGGGVSDSRKLLIEWRGDRTKAVFKSIDFRKPGVTVLADNTREINFTDSYRWEIGAYLLDRALGLNMVPVAVERSVDKKEGAVIEWIDDTINEGERIEQGLRPADIDKLTRKKAVMFVFDSLIYNVDRHAGNWLWTPDWRLYLIDHSRSFRSHKKIPKLMEQQTFYMPRPLYERLRALDIKTLAPALAGAVEKGRVKTLLRRRDIIVSKIELQRHRQGDEFVFGD